MGLFKKSHKNQDKQAAFFTALVKIRNSEKFSEYATKAGASFAAFDGKPVLRGKKTGVLNGVADHDMTGIVQFPSMTALNAWYNSPDYQAIIPLRDAACDMTIITYEIPE